MGGTKEGKEEDGEAGKESREVVDEWGTKEETSVEEIGGVGIFVEEENGPRIDG